MSGIPERPANILYKMLMASDRATAKFENCLALPPKVALPARQQMTNGHIDNRQNQFDGGVLETALNLYRRAHHQVIYSRVIDQTYELEACLFQFFSDLLWAEKTYCPMAKDQSVHG